MAARASGLRARPVGRGLLISRSLVLLNIRANHIHTKHAAHGAPFNIDGKALPGSCPRSPAGFGMHGTTLLSMYMYLRDFKGLIHTCTQVYTA